MRMLSLFLFILLCLEVTCEEGMCQNSFFDIIFLVDASGSVSQVDFPKGIQFIHDVAEMLKIDPMNVRASVIMFSGPGTSVEKISLEGVGSDKKEFLWQTDCTENPDCINRQGLRRATDLHTSLENAYGIFVDEERGYDIPSPNGDIFNPYGKVLVIITDGQTMNEAQDTINADNLKNDLEVEIHGVGVGSGVDHAHIRSLCSDPDYYYELANFDSLSTIVDSLANSFPCFEDANVSREFPTDLLLAAVIFFIGSTCCWFFLIIALLCLLFCLFLSALMGILSLGAGTGSVVVTEAVIPTRPPKATESMYYIGGKQTAVNWGDDGMNFDTQFRPGDMGMGDGFGKEVGLPEYKKKMEAKKKLMEEGGDKKDEKKGWCFIL